MTEEHRRKLSQSHLGKRHSLETRKKMREIKLRNPSPSMFKLGHSVSQDVKEKIAKGNLGKKHTEEFKRKKSLAFSKEKNPNWRGGISKYSSARIKNSNWRNTRKKVLERDGYKCTLCNSINDLIIHHKIPYILTKNDSMENLIVLCRVCHPKIEREYYITNKIIWH